MTALFIKIFNMSITASWIVLAVVVIRYLFKKAPKWLNPVLWGIVGIRLLLPFSFESAFSLIPNADVVSPSIVYDSDVVIDSGISVIDSVVNPIIDESIAENKGTTTNSVLNLVQVVSGVWVIGIVVMLAYTTFSCLRLHKHVKTAVLLKDNVYQSEHVASPFVMGFIRPRIYLPFDISDKDAAYVVAHEQAHIKRHDHFIKPFGFLLLAVYWFNPILWVAYILLCRDIELACDERVIKELAAEARADYSQALLSCSISRKMIAACPLAFGEVGVKERVKNILSYKKPAFWIIVVAIIVSVGLAIGFLTNPVGKSDFAVPFECVYEAKEILYDQTIYSFTYIPNDWLVRYYATEGTLYIKSDILVQREEDTWAILDGLDEIELTKENFDNYFRREGDTVAGWHDDDNSASKVRKNNFSAWRVIDGRYMYYLLQQNDGAVYIACGTYDSEAETDPYSDDSEVRWLFRLEETSEETGVVAVSGENTIPVAVYEPGTHIEEIEDKICWLDIALTDDNVAPFSVFYDGNELYGFYNIYDAETLESIEFIRSLGIESHMSLFESVEDGHEYIVVMNADPTEDEQGDWLCFGVRIDKVKES